MVIDALSSPVVLSSVLRKRPEKYATMTGGGGLGVDWRHLRQFLTFNGVWKNRLIFIEI